MVKWRWWEAIFGKQLTPEQMLRKNQRALRKAIRDIERERGRMETQDKKLIMDIKKMAKENQMDAVKIMAKDLVQTRRYIKHFMMMKANLESVCMKITTLRSQHSISEAMKGVTLAMRSMNRQLQLPQIQAIMKEFEKQSAVMDMKDEAMTEAIDDALGDNEDEEDGNEIVARIFDELGLQLQDQLSDLPEARGNIHPEPNPTRVPVPDNNISGLDELQTRLDNLRRDDLE